MHRSHDVKGTGWPLCDQGQGQIIYFLVNASPHKLFGSSNFKLCLCIGHMMLRVLGGVLCDLDPKVKVKGQIMYFLVNVSSHKLLEVATSNFAYA